MLTDVVQSAATVVEGLLTGIAGKGLKLADNRLLDLGERGVFFKTDQLVFDVLDFFSC